MRMISSLVSSSPQATEMMERPVLTIRSLNLSGLAEAFASFAQPLLDQSNGSDEQLNTSTRRPIALLRAGNHSVGEIARKLDESTSSIRRKIRQIQDIWRLENARHGGLEASDQAIYD